MNMSPKRYEAFLAQIQHGRDSEAKTGRQNIMKRYADFWEDDVSGNGESFYQQGYDQYDDPPPHIPQVGDSLEPDGWYHQAEILEPGDEYVDSAYPGSMFRIPLRKNGLIESWPVNVFITGRPHPYEYGRAWSRCKIEWVKDGEQSGWSGGKIYYDW